LRQQRVTNYAQQRGFLIGEGENAAFDKENVDRIADMQKMDSDAKNVLFNVIDTYIQNFKTKHAFAKV